MSPRRDTLLLLAAGLASACGAKTSLDVPDGGLSAVADGARAYTPDGCAAPRHSTTRCIESAAPLPAPLLSFDFDGDLRNAGDLGSAYDGVLHGAQFGSGVRGQGLLVGASGWAELPGSGAVLHGTAGATISFWIDAGGASGGGPPALDCRSGNGGFHTYLGLADPNELVTCWGAGSGAEPGGCGSVLRNCAVGFHQVTIRYTPPPHLEGTLAIFFDGTLSALSHDFASPMNPFAGQVEDIALGHAHVGDFTSTGRWRVDELRVYDAALTNEQICVELYGGRLCSDQCVPWE